MPPKSKRTPTPAATIPPSPSKTDLPSSASIHEIHNTLHVLYHRNKNQHSCAKWFKQLSVLRRETRKLAWELETVERLEEDFDDGVDLAREDVRRRMEFLGREVVLRCYRAFSTVVADTQFSILGVVLIALLSRLSNTIGAERCFPEKAAEKIRATKNKTKATDDTLPGRDLGEVVTRDQLMSGVSTKSTPVDTQLGLTSRSKGEKRAAPAAKEVEEEPSSDRRSVKDKTATAGAKIGSPSSTVSSERQKEKNKKFRSSSSTVSSERQKEKDEKKRTKKKRKGNAIDDIFGGL